MSTAVLDVRSAPRAAGPRPRLTPRRSPTLITATWLVAATVLAGCGSTSSAGSSTSSPSSTPTAAAASTTSAQAVTVADAWVKAAPSGMTAMFGRIVNPGGQPVTVVSGAAQVAGVVELHEVAMVDGAMKMRPKAGGFEVPAGGSHELKPGADHVMLMKLKKPVAAGDTVTVVLTLSTGSSVTVNAVAKEFTGANESYAPTTGATTGGM